jgi:hypothetical protein
VRWQGVFLDIPIHRIRPHRALPVALLCNSHDVEAFLAIRNTQEVFYEQDASEPVDACLETLISLCTQLSLGAQQRHAVLGQSFSRDALRDHHAVFQVGRAAALKLSIRGYVGVALLAGRRHLSPIAGVKQVHLIWWVSDPANYAQQTFNGAWVIDTFKLCVTHATLTSFRAIAILEGEKDLSSQEFDTLIRGALPGDKARDSPPEGRPRGPLPDETAPASADSASHHGNSEFETAASEDMPLSPVQPTAAPSESDFETAASEMLLAAYCVTTDRKYRANMSTLRRRDTKHKSIRVFWCDLRERTVITADIDIDLLASGHMLMYPVNRIARPLTPEETLQFADEIKQSHLKELRS